MAIDEARKGVLVAGAQGGQQGGVVVTDPCLHSGPDVTRPLWWAGGMAGTRIPLTCV